MQETSSFKSWKVLQSASPFLTLTCKSGRSFLSVAFEDGFASLELFWACWILATIQQACGELLEQIAEKLIHARFCSFKLCAK